MDNTRFKIIYTELLNVARDKDDWIKVTGVVENLINNSVAKAYYGSNRHNIDFGYMSFSKSQVIFFLKTGNPIFFYNDRGEKVHEFKSVQETDDFMLYILMKFIMKKQQVFELEEEVSGLEDLLEIYRDNDAIEYKVRYEECKDRIEELEEKLAKKSRTYNELQAKYDDLLEKHNWET